MAQQAIVIVGSEGASAGWRHVLRALPVRTCEPEALAAELPARLVIVALPPVESIALSQQLAARGVRFVVVLPRANGLVRDHCIVAGAFDVVCDPARAAGRVQLTAAVDAALDGVQRAEARRPWRVAARTQRKRDLFVLPLADLDEVGIGVSGNAPLADGELLRVTLPLDDGPLLAWARVHVADGERFLRPIGLFAAERNQLARTVESSPAVVVVRRKSPAPRTRMIPVPRVPPPAPPPPTEGRTRVMAGLGLVALLSAGVAAGRDPETIRLAPQAFAHLPDVTAMHVTHRRATVRMFDGWSASGVEVGKLQGELYVMGVRWMSVVDHQGTLLYEGPTAMPRPGNEANPE